MTDDRSTREGSHLMSEGQGFDADYEAVEGQADRDLKNEMAGPKHPLEELVGVKNPDGEFAVPAPMSRPGRPGSGNGPEVTPGEVSIQRCRIFKDGNAWCVSGPGFKDPVVSAFGCGKTPQEAYERWAIDARRRPEWEGRPLPRFEDFTIE